MDLQDLVTELKKSSLTIICIPPNDDDLFTEITNLFNVSNPDDIHRVSSSRRFVLSGDKDDSVLQENIGYLEFMFHKKLLILDFIDVETYYEQQHLIICPNKTKSIIIRSSNPNELLNSNCGIFKQFVRHIISLDNNGKYILTSR
jgi:hypothetical protein